MKKNKFNLLSKEKKSEKLERNFLKTNLGKIMFIILATGIIAIILGVGIAIFELFLFLTNTNINDYKFLISLGTSSVITGLICNIVYFTAFYIYKKNN